MGWEIENSNRWAWGWVALERGGGGVRVGGKKKNPLGCSHGTVDRNRWQSSFGGVYMCLGWGPGFYVVKFHPPCVCVCWEFTYFPKGFSARLQIYIL